MSTKSRRTHLRRDSAGGHVACRRDRDAYRWPKCRIGLVGILLIALTAACATTSIESRRTLTDVDPRDQARRTEGPPARVFLISIPGLSSSDYLDPFGDAAAEGSLVRMPTLAQLAREGAMTIDAHAPSPGATRSSHATLVTGAMPNRHGIVSNSILDESGTQATPQLDSRGIKTTTLWDAALGKGVVALDWPSTANARIELLLPELGSVSRGRWLEELRTQTSPALMRELEAVAEEARSGLRKLDRNRDPSTWPNAGEKDAALASTACRIIASERDAGLWLLRFSQAEPVMLSAGRGSVEAVRALASVDAELGELLACLEASGQLADTAIFVTGDIAYESVHSNVAPNVVLAESGLIGRDPRSNTGVRSWLALARSHGRSAYVYARDAKNALEARKVLTTEAELTKAFEVIPAKVLADAGGDPQAWFALTAVPGFLLGNELSGPVIRPSSARSIGGVMRIDSASTRASSVGLVAWGRGIRNRVRMTEAELTDVAPTIAALLGLRLADGIEGRPLLGILRAAVPPPPQGPKRLGGNRSVDDRLRDMREGRSLGDDRGAGENR